VKVFDKYKLLKSLLIFILLQTPSISIGQQKKITEDEAINAIRNLFDSVNLTNYSRESFSSAVTNDFQIFEMGEDFNFDSFNDVLAEAFNGFSSTKWELSKFKVLADLNQAHVSYHNHGEFLSNEGEKIISFWLESALVVRDGENFEVAFLQSDLVERSLIKVDGTELIIYPVIAEE
jgi:hypothetical protein